MMNERLERVVAAQIARTARKFGAASLFVERADGRRLRIVGVGLEEPTETESVGNAIVYRRRRSFVVSLPTWRAIAAFIGGPSFRDGERIVEIDGDDERTFRPDVPVGVETTGGGYSKRIRCEEIKGKA